MRSVWANVLLILLFVLVGGVFAATEMALVSLRETQLRGLADRGRRGARVAAVAADPNRFLGAVQIGVTLAGFLSAAFGAATLAGELSPVLQRWGLSSGLADAVALVAITLVISYLSLVLGELAPKRIALQRAESVALAVAPMLDRFASAMSPVIWLLSHSTDLVVRLLGGDPRAGRDEITDEELRTLVSGHHALGPEERELIEEVFEAGDRSLREVMVPRTEVDFLDASLPVPKAVRLVAQLTRSRFPVVRGDPDNVVGFVHVRDLYGPQGGAHGARVGDLAREVMLLPDGKQVLPALSEMRRAGQHLAIVVDEYGGTAGIVTLEDIVEELIGDIRDEYDLEEEPSRLLVGGALDVDGLLNLDDFEDVAGFALPEGPYETVAGFVLAALGHIPDVGEHVDVEGYRLSVTQTDGRRVARVRVAPAG